MPNDSRMYPIGAGYPRSRVSGSTFVDFGVTKTQRTRLTVAQVTAGFTLLPALPGVKWRLVDASVIAVGGTTAAGTSVDISGTRAAAAVILLSALIAGLTRSRVLRMGETTNGVVLADGASHTALDSNTAVTVKAVGSTFTGVTHWDVLLTYVADQA